MFCSTILSAFVLAATGVSAHATFQELWINGVDQVKKCTRLPNSNNPVTSPSGSDITCNAGGNTPAPSTCPINAGDSLIVEMHQHDTRGCGEEAIGGAHYGPVIVYMAKVSDAATTSPQSAGWFKVAQAGLITSSPKFWGTDQMNKDCGKVPFKVPSDIAPGDYLIRAEAIALHSAASSGGAQFYMSCYQVKVSGSGSASPATVRFPGAYSSSDPGILVDINKSGFNSYTIPGPAVYGGGGGSSPQPSQTTVQTTTSRTSTAAPTQSTTTGQTVDRYGQCGGNDYKGPTTCTSPYKCVGVSVPYYYQCQ